MEEEALTCSYTPDEQVKQWISENVQAELSKIKSKGASAIPLKVQENSWNRSRIAASLSIAPNQRIQLQSIE